MNLIIKNYIKNNYDDEQKQNLIINKLIKKGDNDNIVDIITSINSPHIRLDVLYNLNNENITKGIILLENDENKIALLEKFIFFDIDDISLILFSLNDEKVRKDYISKLSEKEKIKINYNLEKQNLFPLLRNSNFYTVKATMPSINKYMLSNIFENIEYISKENLKILINNNSYKISYPELINFINSNNKYKQLFNKNIDFHNIIVNMCPMDLTKREIKGTTELKNLEIEALVNNFSRFNGNQISKSAKTRVKKNDKIKTLLKKEKALKKINPNFQTYPEFDWILLSDSITNKLSYEQINQLLEFKTGAAKLLVDSVRKNTIEQLFENINYLKNSYSITSIEEFHHLIINSYDNFKLIQNLKNYQLNNPQINVLKIIFNNKNTFNINNFEELNNYDEISKKNVLSQSPYDTNITIYHYKNLFCQRLFGKSIEELRIITNQFYANLEQFEFINKKVDNPISEEDITLLHIIETMLKIEMPEEIENIENDLFNIKFSVEVDNLIEKLRKLYTAEYQKEIFDYNKLNNDELAKVNSTKINGVDVINIEEIPFKMIVHSLKTGFDNDNDALTKNVHQDFNIWNTGIGTSTISATLISDKHLNTAPNPGFFLEFGNINESSIISMGPDDIYVEHAKQSINPNTTKACTLFMPPDDLILMSGKKSYTEVVLKRKQTDLSSLNNNNGNQTRLQPTGVVVFDSNVSKEAISCAKHFNVNILNINKTKYQSSLYQNNQNNREKYAKTFTEKSLHEIIYDKTQDPYDLVDRINFCLSSIKKSVESGNINIETAGENLRKLKEKVSYCMSYITAMTNKAPIDFMHNSRLIKLENNIKEIDKIDEYINLIINNTKSI